MQLYFITAFKKTPDSQSEDELNADMSSSFRGNPRLAGEDVIKREMLRGAPKLFLALIIC